jgi:CTP synthase (UTP-ammonia lyase)
VAPQYCSHLERAGAVLAGRAPDGGVVAIELPQHPFFLATAFQPQVGLSSSRACIR